MHTFSVGFESDSHDEGPFQHVVSKMYETNHHERKISSKDIVENFSDVIWHAEAPLFRTAPVPMYLLAQVVQSAGIKVVLTGEGADETFLGYDLFRETLLRQDLADIDDQEQMLERIRSMYRYMGDMDGRTNEVSMLRYFRQYSKERQPGLFPMRPDLHWAALRLD